MTSIFVAKLDFNTTEEQLKSLFEEHGRVNRVTIAKDRETGKPRGFAFVEMADESEADRAIEALDDSDVNGRNIAVKKADDRASGGKPTGDNNRPGDRPAFRSDRPREDRGSVSDVKTDYKKPDENRISKPSFGNPDETIPAKGERKKEKDPRSTIGGSKDAPKKPKMEAYRKSGKDNQFLNDDDLSDEELDLFGRNGEEDEEEDYRKYLVNNDEDSDEDYSDEDEWEDDEDEEDNDEEK